MPICDHVCLTILLFLISLLQNQNSNVKLNNTAINSNYKDQLHRSNSNKDDMSFMKQRNDAYTMTKILAAQKHQQQQRIQSEVNHQQHNPLARTVSTPMPIPDANQVNVNTLFSSLNDILNGTSTASSAHRKLERTQSEPIPQTNTSR